MDRTKLEAFYEGDAGSGGDGYVALVEAAERLPGVKGVDALALHHLQADAVPAADQPPLPLDHRQQALPDAGDHRAVAAAAGAMLRARLAHHLVGRAAGGGGHIQAAPGQPARRLDDLDRRRGRRERRRRAEEQRQQAAARIHGVSVFAAHAIIRAA